MQASISVNRGYIEVQAIIQHPYQWGSFETPFCPWDHISSTKAAVIQCITQLLHPAYTAFSYNLDLLIQDYMNGQTVSVSNGSYFPVETQAAVAWIIESNCRTQWIMGSLITPGPSIDYSAYCSELTGLLAISVTLRLLPICFPPSHHSIIGCDGQATLSILTTHS
jgi:hypothetical protein